MNGIDSSSHRSASQWRARSASDRIHALTTHHQSVAERRHGGAKGVGASGLVLLQAGLAFGVEDVDEHASCMQVDAAIISMLLALETDDRSPWGRAGAPIPGAPGLRSTLFAERSTLGRPGAPGLIPFYLGRAAGSSPLRP